MNRIVKEEVLQSNKIAILDDRGNKVTYKELGNRAKELGKYIEERGFLFILCDRHMETLEFLYEILYLNRVPLLLSSDIIGELLDSLIEIYHPQYIYCDKSREITGEYQQIMETDKHMLLSTGRERPVIHQDIAVLLSTSGTTGSPKLVKLSYRNLYKNAENICSHLGIESGQKGLTPLLASFVYGLNICIWHWYCGATLCTTEEFVFSKKFEEFFKKEKVNNFGGTPYIFEMMQKVQFWDSEKTLYLQRAMSAGSKMSEKEMADMVSVLKEKFWILYGQTESTGIVSGTNFADSIVRSGNIGYPFGNIKALIDSSTEELVLRSKDIINLGYANQIEQLAYADIEKESLHTGDIACIDNKGCICLKGRMTRYVKVLGKRVSLDDIENYLKNKNPNIEFACVGVDDSLFVFHTSFDSMMEKEIKRLLDQNMKIPGRFVVCLCLKKILRNYSGKILYGELEKLANAQNHIQVMS